MTIKAKDFEHIVQKLDLQTRNSGDRLAWFVHEGKPVTHTRRSLGRGNDLPFQHSIRQQLKLSEDEFRAATQCHLSRDDYISILKRKGLL